MTHCPSDDGAYDGYGNSYTGNYFSGSSATRPFYTLLDPTDATKVRTVKGVMVRNPSNFIVAGENAGVSKGISGHRKRQKHSAVPLPQERSLELPVRRRAFGAGGHHHATSEVSRWPRVGCRLAL